MFGRRKTSAISSPPPDDDGVRRVIPKSHFEGEHKKLYYRIGFTADDPSNLMPTQQLIDARADVFREAQDRFVAKINKELPGENQVQPWAMIPWEVWQGEHAELLMVGCEYYPTQPWNTMLLPWDERSSFVVNLPEHPRGAPDDLVPNINAVLQEARDNRPELALPTSGDLSNIGMEEITKYNDALEGFKLDLINVAHYSAQQVFGEEAYDRHYQIFGTALGYPSREAA